MRVQSTMSKVQVENRSLGPQFGKLDTKFAEEAPREPQAAVDREVRKLIGAAAEKDHPGWYELRFFNAGTSRKDRPTMSGTWGYLDYMMEVSAPNRLASKDSEGDTFYLRFNSPCTDKPLNQGDSPEQQARELVTGLTRRIFHTGEQIQDRFNATTAL